MLFPACLMPLSERKPRLGEKEYLRGGEKGGKHGVTNATNWEKKKRSWRRGEGR